jgi:hypothetical protein
MGFFTIQQSFQFEKCLRLIKKLYKIVTAATGKDRYCSVVIPGCTGHHFVQRAIATAGINAVFLSALGGFPGKTGAFSRRTGYFDPITEIPGGASFFDFLPVFGSPIPTASRGVDDEQMGHRFHLLCFKFQFIVPFTQTVQPPKGSLV